MHVGIVVRIDHRVRVVRHRCDHLLARAPQCFRHFESRSVAIGHTENVEGDLVPMVGDKLQYLLDLADIIAVESVDKDDPLVFCIVLELNRQAIGPRPTARIFAIFWVSDMVAPYRQLQPIPNVRDDLPQTIGEDRAQWYRFVARAQHSGYERRLRPRQIYIGDAPLAFVLEQMPPSLGILVVGYRMFVALEVVAPIATELTRAGHVVS